MGAAAELKEAYPAIKISASDIEAPYISGELKNLRLQQGEALQDGGIDTGQSFPKTAALALDQDNILGLRPPVSSPQSPPRHQ